MNPTAEQLAALDAFRRMRGRRWKAELRFCWETGMWPAAANSALLQQLRNRLGPEWLLAYRVGDTGVAWLDCYQALGSPLPKYVLVDQANTDLRLPWSATKTEARQLARDLNLTLIEV